MACLCLWHDTLNIDRGALQDIVCQLLSDVTCICEYISHMLSHANGATAVAESGRQLPLQLLL